MAARARARAVEACWHSRVRMGLDPVNPFQTVDVRSGVSHPDLAIPRGSLTGRIGLGFRLRSVLGSLCSTGNSRDFFPLFCGNQVPCRPCVVLLARDRVSFSVDLS